MKAMLLRRIQNIAETSAPLECADLPDPVPSAVEILVRVKTCGVCHTELDEFEERFRPPQQLHSIIDTTPAYMPILISLAHLKAGGRLVINAIR